jgi:hypothetical protein
MFIRRLPEFEHHGPLPVSEALRLLAKYGDKAQVYAGGTDLLAAMKKRERHPFLPGLSARHSGGIDKEGRHGGLRKTSDEEGV